MIPGMGMILSKLLLYKISWNQVNLLCYFVFSGSDFFASSTVSSNNGNHHSCWLARCMSVGDHVFMFNFNRFWKMHSILYLDSYTASFAISVASTSSLFVLLRGHGDNMAIFVCPKFHSLETQKKKNPQLGTEKSGRPSGLPAVALFNVD